MLARPLDQHRRVVADPAVDQRPLDAVGQRGHQPGQLGRDRREPCARPRSRAGTSAGRSRPTGGTGGRRWCIRSAARRGWCASRSPRSAGTARGGTTRTAGRGRSAPRTRGRPRRPLAVREGRPGLHDHADILVAHDDRGGVRRLRVHLHVRAADAGDLDFQQRTVGRDRGRRELPQLGGARGPCARPPARSWNLRNGLIVCHPTNGPLRRPRCPNRRLRAVSRTQGNNRALKDGTVRLAHYELDFEEVPVLPQAFRRMVRGLEFDVCEMALTTYLVASATARRSARCPSSWSAASTTARSGPYRQRDHRAEGPRGPRGRGQPWLHGHHRCVGAGHPARGVRGDLDKVTWVLSGDEHVTEYQPPPNVVGGGDLSEDAVIGPSRTTRPWRRCSTTTGTGG